jgi:hypothetical protein
LTLILRAIWACRSGDVESFYDYPAYKVWVKENGAKLREDLEEVMASEEAGH